MTVIRSLQASLARVPLARPWGSDVTSVGVVATRVELSDGSEGLGFSWTPQIGAEAVHALLTHDIAPVVAGRDADPTRTWDGLWRHLHEAGGGGLTTIALAGLDLALWDARARAAGRSIADEVGRRRDRVRAYGSGVNLHYTRDELVDQVRRWVAAGFPAVKIKVGRPDIAEDVDRVAAVRDVLGPDRELMIDANQRWDLETATTAMQRLERFSPAWIEEPLRADDLPGHVALAERIPTPIAVGENIHTTYRFEEFLASGAAAVVQPNIVRVGGITPFLRIAERAGAHGVAVHPHLLPELSGQLALTLPGDPWAEDVEDAGFAELGALTSPCPVRISAGALAEVPHLGIGMRFPHHPPTARTGN